jgi:hypothetical protein
VVLAGLRPAQDGAQLHAPHPVSQTAQEISRIQNDTYWARQASQDRINRDFSDYIRGVVRLRDETTGELMEAPAGSDYYIRVRGPNTAIGSDTGDRPPNLDVTLLLQMK